MQHHSLPTKKADSIPKSITCLTIEESVVNTGETIESQEGDEDIDDNWEHPEETEEINNTEDSENIKSNILGNLKSIFCSQLSFQNWYDILGRRSLGD